MHQGPHLFLLSSAPWGCRHLGRSALYCCPPALNTPTPTLAPQVDPGQGKGQEWEQHCLEKDSTRIQ